MQLSDFLIMRSELSLLIIIIVLLHVEIFSSTKNRRKVVVVASALLLLHTIIGFIPSQEGQLFGGMYNHNGLTELMKGVLNIGVFILILQSSGWMMK